MTFEEYKLRYNLAGSVLREPIIGWWAPHDPDCPELQGGGCNCMPDVWFSGLARTVCVTPSLEIFIYSIH